MPLDMRFAALAILGIYAAVAVLERIPQLRFRRAPLLRPHFATDAAWYASAAALTLGFGPLFERLNGAVEALGVPTLARLELPLWGLVPLAVVLYDLGAFASHRLLHRSERLWRLHKVHHSSPLLDWLATTRAHAAEHLFRNLPVQGALFALGLPTSAVALGLVVYAAFATLGHSNLRLRLGFAEWLFVTPRLHRLHHVPDSSSSNFGTVFSLWDRIGGSLLRRDTGPEVRLGVPGELDSYPQGWWPQLREPFAAAATLAAPGVEREVA